MPPRMIRVFLSSTAKDLGPHREAAYQAICGFRGYHCVRMEDFDAQDWEADAFCQAKVTECDIFVGVVGHCYGSCPEGSETSFTEREYEGAVEADKPCLMFLAREDFPVPANLRETDAKNAKQQKFRDRIPAPRIFTSPPELALDIVQALHNREQLALLGLLDKLLWADLSREEDTAGFRQMSHDTLIRELLERVNAALDGLAQAANLQSLGDAGCDIVVSAGPEDAKAGIQVKSYGDIAASDFAVKTMAQIADSKRHGLKRLYLILAGDLTDPSQSQKVRGLHSRVSQMSDRYVTVIPPEQAWSLFRGPQELVPRAAPPLMPPPRPPCFVHPYPLQKHFTGRVTERAMLTEWLAKGTRPVLSLVAIGGMGKSALSWAWVQRDLLGLPLPGLPEDACDTGCRVPEAARPEGVFWWSFYERESTFEAFVTEALAYASGGAVDLAAIPSPSERARRLVGLLQQKRILLVLDGFERQLRAYSGLDAARKGDTFERRPGEAHRACVDPHAAAFLRWAAAGAMAGRVLLTTRLHPLELDGCAGCRREDLTGLAPDDAVAFFHAHGIKGNRAEIEAACAPCGYHPLALRLLAGVIAKDRKDPGDIGAAGRHPVLPDLAGKHQHHILVVAYDTLDETKQALLSRIAAFRSPMEYEAVKVLNPYKKEAPFEAALAELIDRGLLLWDREASRYDLHPIVRGYAYDRLSDKKGVHARLRDYFAAVPEPEKVERLEDLAATIELYHHTVSAGRYDEAYDLYYDRLAKTLYYGLGAYQTCIDLLGALFPDGEDKPPRLKKPAGQAWTLNELATSCSLSGRPRRAVPLFEAANTVDEKRGDKLGLAIGLVNLVNRWTELGELAAAEANLRQGIDLGREVKAEFLEAVGHEALARLLARRGAFDEAERELDAALASFTKLGQVQSQGIAWAHCALRALLMGDAKAALAAARRAREFAEETARTRYPHERDFIQAEWLIGWSLAALAGEDDGRREALLTEAEGHLTDALTRCRRINLVQFEPDILLAWARWHRAKGSAAEARRHAEEALAIADRCEYRLVQADVHNFLAVLDLDGGKKQSAEQHAQTAYERAWCDGPPHAYQPALDEAKRLLDALGVPPPAL